MKNDIRMLLLLVSSIFATSIFAQSFVVLPEGLRDASKIENSYLVLKVENLDANQLYLNDLNFVENNFGNSKTARFSTTEDVINQIEGKSITFKSYIKNFIPNNNSSLQLPLSARFTTKLDFKQGKVKYEIIRLEVSEENSNLPRLFTDGLFAGALATKKIDPYNPETKTVVENKFNTIVSDLHKSLKGELDEDW